MKKKLKKKSKERVKEERGVSEALPGPSLELWQKEPLADSGPGNSGLRNGCCPPGGVGVGHRGAPSSSPSVAHASKCEEPCL